MYLSKNGYVVPKKLITVEQLASLKKDLVGKPAVDDKYKTVSKTFTLYTETQNNIHVPKMYGLKHFGPAKETVQYNGSLWYNPNPISFVGNLKEDQVDPCNILYKELIDNYGGIFCAITGNGKTVSCLYTLARLGKKTLVLVNKISLLYQWTAEIKTFLPNARVGYIWGKKRDVVDKDIIITLIQTLVKGVDPELVQDIGVLVIDEIHNIASQKFSQILKSTCCKYTIGLTATPVRSDKCEYVFEWYIGPIVYKSDPKKVRQGKIPIIAKLILTSKDYKQITSKDGTIQFTSMISELIEMKNRNLLVQDIVKWCIKDSRKILILSERREHCKELYNDLKDYAGLILGGMKPDVLQSVIKCQVIISTFKFFGEGISVKELDTIILTTPKKFIGHIKDSAKNDNGKLEQAIGRIFRKEHIILHPLIIDLQDSFSVYSSQSSSRNVFYKSCFGKNAIHVKESINLDTFKDYSMNNIMGKNIDSDSEPSDTELEFGKCLIDM